ncbi:MAG TPA: flotillin domain-containing protein, partial [Candidatus Limnocylindria bacterium]
HRTTVEGNAEAEITLTQGEAAAKALALRAEAYKQFNEAAVIQTVLSMLPDIVRAAAEPMGNIDSLTVLSTDGASEMVKNTTRTVAEAGAAVKSLTGLDVAGLINEAVGRHASSSSSASAAPDAGPSRTAVSAARQPSQRRTLRGAAAPTASAPAAPPPAERFAEAVETIEHAGTVTPEAGPSLEIRESMPADQASQVLGRALAAVPGIGRYADMTVDELGRRGPRLARALWGRVPDAIRGRIGDATIGSLLERSGT